MTPECQLFGTLGCHLCEVAEALLMPFVENGLLVELIDIAEHEGMVEQYGLRIPGAAPLRQWKRAELAIRCRAGGGFSELKGATDKSKAIKNPPIKAGF